MSARRVVPGVALALFAFFLPGFLAVSPAQDGLSRNVGGFVKTTVPTNGLVLVSVPFVDFSGSGNARRFVDLFSNQLVGGASFAISDNILQWNALDQKYNTFWKNNAATSIWRLLPEAAETTKSLPAGQGFFVRNRQTNVQSVFITGELPSREVGEVGDTR